ncbi:3-beta-hydroxysteroid-Delta(8),Delta(7)-isomerase-like [Corticium candelabrum]|uniref:3-beta-hydroxysteroid-Delta(8), Delta(7)-isomerase-like n=1 Tax=Corticium candelabrum TaxID=121492 RepID=UPI002E26BEAB|nr:3-beta-hydroxysteroid-Delta(8),Delta(7)-isomerase-like [Corticium candelabrum]
MNSSRGIVGYTTEELTVGWTDPINAIPIAVIAVCLSFFGSPRNKTAAWTLFNSAIIHSWMDGLVGSLGRGPLWMVNEYTTLDSRFWPTQDSTVMAMSMFELLVMGPLAFAWYGAIQQDRWYQHPLCLVVSSFHMMGDFMYMFAEAWDEFKHLPVKFPLQFNSYYEFKYFWFVFIGLNLIWFIVPLTLMYKSLQAMKPKEESRKNK